MERGYVQGVKALALAIVVTVLLAGQAEAAPKLSQKDAALYTRTALARNFKGQYTANVFESVKCSARGFSTQRCKVSWVVGDLAFYGRVRIWLDERFWNYAYRIVRFDEYCASVTQGPDCTKLFVVK